MSMSLLKADALPVVTRGVSASLEPAVTITSNGQFRLNKAAKAVFAGKAVVQLGWDGQTGENLDWSAQSGEKRKLAFIGANQATNGAVHFPNKEDAQGSLYFAGSRVCHLIGWPYSVAGNQKFEAVVNEKQNSVSIELPEVVPPAPPKRTRRTKNVDAPTQDGQINLDAE